MSDSLFNLLKFARSQTLSLIEDMEESKLDMIPQGFNNHIRWNLGHIYTVQEKFAFHFTQGPIQLSDEYVELFAKDTKPADWKISPPSIAELKSVLQEQIERVQKYCESRFTEKVPTPFTTATGLTLATVGDFLTQTLYHEGMHFDRMKVYKRILNQ